MNMMKRNLLKPAVYSLAVLTVIAFSYLLFLVYYEKSFYPGVSIGGYPMGGKSPASGLKTLDLEFKERSGSIEMQYEDQNFTLDLKGAQPEINIKDKVTEAYASGRSGSFLENLRFQFQALFFGTNFPLNLRYEKQNHLTDQIEQLGKLVKVEAIDAKITLADDLQITPSKTGKQLDQKELQEQISLYLTYQRNAPETLPVKITEPRFTTASAQKAKAVLETLKQSPITLSYEDFSFIIDQKVLLRILDTHKTKPVLASLETEGRTITLEEISFGSKQITDEQSILDPDNLEEFLNNLAKDINQPTRDAKFIFDTGARRVREFQPEVEGRELDIGKTSKLITAALSDVSARNITLPVKVTKPKINASSINSFGIQELLGQGFSRFAGSIENRIYNVGLASSRINGTLIAPGETFSFNNVVGEISGASGYKPAYVIKSGRTVLDDGGGVCQVSTTLFRAVLNAGLPITARTAHAYRVGYYEQGFPPGLDATVFSPTVDFKFKNDTTAHILIQAYTSGTSLTIDIYGTSDGRVTALSTPKVLNQTPPPPELRQDDPELPRGTVKQVDWSAWGANVSFTRNVTRAGQTLISETFRSNYKAWQAIFLVGTKD